MNTMLVAAFISRNHAEPWRKRLDEKGIPAEIHDEPALGQTWFTSKTEGGARLEVPEAQFERAYDLLADWDSSENSLEGIVRCPECRSLRVYYPQYTRRSLIPNLVVGTLATIGRVEKEFYCEDCHLTWPREGTKPSAVRPHSAPYFFIDGIEQTAASEQPKPPQT